MDAQDGTSYDTKESIHGIFQQLHADVEAQIEKLPSIPAGSRPPAIDHCLAGISRLSDLLKDASTYLPAYDQRTYSQRVKVLSDKLADVRQSLAPKQKFAFKSKRKDASAGIGGALKPSSQSPAAVEPSTAHRAAGTAEPENVVIADQSGRHVRPALPDVATAGTASLLLSSLTRCVVSLPASARFSSSALKDIDASLLLLGDAVNGPVHLTNVRSATLVLACRQFRMHDARNVDVYLRCQSRPIIEDCENVRFAPYGDGHGNLWDQVDDFKWLRSEQSPHWSVLPADARVPGEKWTELRNKGAGEVDVLETLDTWIPGRGLLK